MRHRVERIEPLPAARISGTMYFVFGLLGAVFLVLFDRSAPGDWTNVALAIGAPFLYGLAGAIIGAVGAWLYNVAARRFGGLEFIVSPVDTVVQSSSVPDA